MDPLNLQVMVNANGTSGERLKQALDAIRASRYKDRMVMFTSIDLRDVGPGFGAKIAAQLEADVKAGALGVGEIMKGFGLTSRKTDGTRLKLDDPELDPVWETAARLNIPVFIHVADPAEFFQPLDYQQRALAGAWRCIRTAATQDRSRFPVVRRADGASAIACSRSIRKTTSILAHLGWHANDLGRLGAMFDQMPNLYAEVGAVLYDIGRQPRAAHEFFVEVPGSAAVRQGQLPARRVSVLLARVRDQRRVLRLLPRLPRLLEAVRHRAARRRAEEAVLRERAEASFPAFREPAFRTANSTRHGFVSRHRRRRIHRLASGGRARAPRPSRARASTA